MPTLMLYKLDRLTMEKDNRKINLLRTIQKEALVDGRGHDSL